MFDKSDLTFVCRAVDACGIAASAIVTQHRANLLYGKLLLSDSELQRTSQVLRHCAETAANWDSLGGEKDVRNSDLKRIRSYLITLTELKVLWITKVVT